MYHESPSFGSTETLSQSSLRSLPEGFAHHWEGQDLIRVCRRTVATWRGLPKSSFLIHPISGGMTNYLYRCSTTYEGGEPSSALLRIFGAENTICRVKDNTIFKTLAETGLGPKLYGTFDGGRVEEFLEDSRPLTNEEMKVEKYSRPTARRLGMVHELKIPLDRSIPQLLKDCSQLAAQISSNSSLQNLLPEKSEYYADRLQQLISKSESPITFCHNDLQEGNILLNTKTDELTLIDFEYGGYNYAMFDIGNHFAEYAFAYVDHPAGDLAFELRRDEYPNRRQMLTFLSEYTSVVQSSKDPEDMIDEAQRFMCLSHLYWSLWAATMSLRGEGYVAYMNTRLSEFEYFAEKIL